MVEVAGEKARQSAGNLNCKFRELVLSSTITPSTPLRTLHPRHSSHKRHTSSSWAAACHARHSSALFLLLAPPFLPLYLHLHRHRHHRQPLRFSAAGSALSAAVRPLQVHFSATHLAPMRHSSSPLQSGLRFGALRSSSFFLRCHIIPPHTRHASSPHRRVLFGLTAAGHRRHGRSGRKHRCRGLPILVVLQ